MRGPHFPQGGGEDDSAIERASADQDIIATPMQENWYESCVEILTNRADTFSKTRPQMLRHFI